MNQLRPNTRIRPIRPYWSRTKVVTVTALSALALFWVATAWLQRHDQQLVLLPADGRYRFESSAGPIDVTEGRRPLLRYDASWLLSGPNLDLVAGTGAGVPLDPPFDSPVDPLLSPAGPATDRSVVRLSCATRFPCRAASRLELPAGSSIEVESNGGTVSVAHFDGSLDVATTASSDVFLGAVAGRLTITTDRGDVYGFGLSVTEITVDTVDGEIELHFATRPRRLIIRSDGGPVTLRLPDGDYAVNVESGSSAAVNVGQAASADSEIFVQARGPVRIDATR